MKGLDNLIEAVESGTLTDIGQEWRLAAMPREWWEPIVKSNSGSLDAAKALHEALLPEWDWHINARFHFAKVFRGTEVFEGISLHNPARALLLATLKAYRTTQETKP